MFDYVNCDLSLLPVSDEERDDMAFEGADFQSKTFEWPEMSTYDISPPIDANGCQLFRTPKDWGTLTEDRVECQAMSFTGTLNFYGDGRSGHWYEFNASFIEGRLIEITRDLESEKENSR